MSVIIRLQGLPWTASAMNIRHFFTGLNIPAGGVHIIGGEGGDAFIAFSSDEDARVAMKMNMSPLNGMTVQLFLSSKSEMQSVIDAARSSGPSTVSSSQNIPQVPAMPGNMAQTGMGQAGVTGVNPMGVPTGKPMMPNLSQPPQMSGFQGMQGHHGQAQMMGQKNNFQNMQQAMDINQQVDGSSNAMAGGGNNNNMMGGGMNMGGRNEWQGYPGMDGVTDNQNQSMNMNMAQFQNSQNMMGGGGGGGQGNQFSRFQNMRQQQLQQNQEDAFSGASGQRDMMSGRQGFGQDMSAAKGKMDHAGGMMSQSQNQSQSRFDESGMRPSWMGGGGIVEKPGQFPGMADKNNMNQGFSPSQRSGSTSKDESMTAVAGQIGRGPESMATAAGGFSKDRLGRNQMPLEQTGSANTPSNMDAWGGEKKMENFPDSRSRFEPDNRRDQMFRPDMGGSEEPPFRQEGRKRVNRFAEVPENPETTPPGPFSMGMNRGGDSVAGFSDRETRMQDQFRNRFRSSHEPSPGRLPERAQGRPGGDRGSQAGTEDGLPSTRYPPDDEAVPPVPDSSRFMGGRGLLDQPRGMPEDNRIMTGDRRNLPDSRRDMRDDRMGMADNRRGLGEDRRSMSDDHRAMPEDRRAMPEDRRAMPDDRRAMPDDRRAMPDDRRAMPDDRRAMPDDRRAMPDDRRFRQRMSRLDHEEGGMSMEQDERFPPNDRRFPPEERGFPGNRPRFPPNDRFGDDMGREFPADDRFPPERSFQDGDRDGRTQAGDDRKFPPGEGRPMPEDRMGMWPEDKMRDEDMMGRRPGDNMFAPDDPRFSEREEELRREAFERGARGPDERFMYGRGRGGMRGMGRPGGDYYGMRPFPPDRRGGFPPERQGGFRGEDERDYPYGPDGYPEGPDRWNRFDRMPDKDGLLDKPDGMGGAEPERKPLLSTPEDGGSLDMDQRFDRDMGPDRGGRRPDMFREDGGFDYGHGPPMDEGFGRGAPPPRDFDSRAVGPRGRGGPPMMDRGPRGRGEPFGRGRHGGMPPFARGREREGEGMFEEQGPMVQDVDNRKMEGFPTKPDQQGMPVPDRPVPGAGGRGLLGDAPVFPGQSNNSRKEDQKGDAGDKDVDSRPPRRNDDRDRDRRHNDDRRGRDREDRDRHSYRGGRYDRDKERDRDRSDRRRSRSRSRDRGGRDSRHSRENRERSSKDKSSKSDTDLLKSDSSKTQQRQTRFLLVKNMPPTLSFRDMRRFFQPMEIPFDGIKVINDKDGNRIGEANVYFNRLEDAIKAQKRNGDRVEGRPVCILFSTEDDFNKAVDSFVPGPKQDDPTSAAAKPQDGKMRYIAQLKNLPASITRQDINTFFKNLKIDKEGEAAYIEFDQSGVATGVGFVEFKSDTDYKKALTQDGNKLGANNVRVLPGKTDEADKLKAVQGEMFQRAAVRNIASKTGPLSGQRPNLGPQLISQLPAKQTPQQQPSQTPPHMKPLIPPLENNEQGNVCVHIQGLPLLATSHDIREFFSDCQIATRGINIAHDGSGKPLGEGFVEFKFKSGVEKALKKDKTSLGRHIVAVKPISKKEMTDRLGGAKHQGDGPPKLPTSLSGPPSSQSSNSMGTSQSPQVQKIPFPKPPPVQENPARNNQQPPPQQQQQQLPQLPPQQQRNNQMTPQQQQQQQRNNQQQPRQQQQAQQNQAKQPDTPDSKGPPSNPNQQRPSTQDMGNNGPMGGQPMALLQTPQGPPLVVAPGGGKSFPPGVLNSNWFYIRCQNFPADISIAEIMQFFNTFRPIGESIRLHYSSEGHPTGNAVVGFNTAEDANRAMQALSMKFSRHNPVSLHPA